MAIESYVEVIESKGWSLHNVNSKYLQAELLDDRQTDKCKPVRGVEEGEIYLFVPQPLEG